jgi:hypothetical protein
VISCEPIISHDSEAEAHKNDAGDVPFQENIARVRKVRGFKRRERVQSAPS